MAIHSAKNQWLSFLRRQLNARFEADKDIPKMKSYSAQCEFVQSATPSSVHDAIIASLSSSRNFGIVHP